MPVPARDSSESFAAALLRLRDHPIFSPPSSLSSGGDHLEPLINASPGAGASQSTLAAARRNICTRDGDLIVAVGSEIRMAPLPNLAALPSSTAAPNIYKRLDVQDIDFPIVQMEVNENGRLLAISGLYEVVVVILPRDGYVKSLHDSVACRAVKVGPYHYSRSTGSKLAKIHWHPWGFAASTLLVLTDDGVIREFDIAANPEVPLQTFNILPVRRSSNAFSATSDSATSFTVGQGKADWGPMTLYVLTGNGDIYSVCPYVPFNAQIPFDYLDSLNSLVLNRRSYFESGPHQSMTMTYDEQSQFLQGLRRQASAHVGKSSHPNGIREAVIRGRHSTDKTAAIQGPFLLQPSPLELDTDGGAATDIIYMTRHDVEGSIAGGTVHIVAIAYQDGKVDICLDVIKVEPRWESGLKTKRSIPNVDELPILLVFETIDLGIGNLSETLIAANFPQLLGDAVNPEAFYVFHIAGIHGISMSPWIPTIRTALSREPQLLISGLKDSKHSEVGKVWSSEASESLVPIVGLVPITNLNLPEILLAMTSKPELVPLVVRPAPAPSSLQRDIPDDASVGEQSFELTGPPSLRNSQRALEPPSTHYTSLLTVEPFAVRALQFPRITVPQKSIPETGADSLKRLKFIQENLSGARNEFIVEISRVETRIELQEMERSRQAERVHELLTKYNELQDEAVGQMQRKLIQLVKRKEEIEEKARRVTSLLQRSSAPKLSASEREWFAELKVLKDEIGLGVNHHASSLTRQKMQLDSSIAAITSSLRKTNLDDAPAKSMFTYSSMRPTNWGSDQLHRYVNRLQFLQNEIGSLYGRTETMLNSVS